MKGYKGFDKDMRCKDFQYEVGKTYKHEGNIAICESGFHFCRNLTDIFLSYAPSKNRFCKVETKAECKDHPDDSKQCTSEITIGTEISIPTLCEIAVPAFFEQFDFWKKIKDANTYNAGDYGAANAGNYGAANAGYRGSANVGDRGAANAGDQGTANAGDQGTANAGYRGAANVGDRGAANAGHRGSANAGNYGAANAGDYGVANVGDRGAANAGYRGFANAGGRGAANAGDQGVANVGDQGTANAGNYGAANAGDYGVASVGKNGVAIASTRGRVKGAIGAILVLIDRDNFGETVDFACAPVDDIKIKADTFYTLKCGQFVKANQE